MLSSYFEANLSTFHWMDIHKSIEIELPISNHSISNFGIDNEDYEAMQIFPM